ncbi:MAG: hypothetical protein HC829_09145 [Bacteroidales bacterium]|nr:hypothetical protein [Bacteroidales bacterium]
MTLDRRALLGGMTGAAMLAPFLAVEKAMAQQASHAAAAGSPGPRDSEPSPMSSMKAQAAKSVETLS